MSAINYAEIASETIDAIAEAGAAATLRRTTPGVYDPATGSATPTVTELAVTAVVFDYPHKYIDGTLIKQGDRQAYMLSSSAPAIGDELTWQSVRYTITSVKQTSPAGVPVLYEANLRG